MIYVQIFQAQIPKYRFDFFSQLIRKGIEENFCYVLSTSSFGDFIAIREKYPDLINNFKYVKSKIIKFWNKSILIPQIRNFDTFDLNISEHALGNFFYFLPLLSKRREYIFAFWGHGATFTKKSSKFLEIIKFHLANRGDYYFVYTNEGAEKLLKLGFKPRKIVVVQNSSRVASLRQEISDTSIDLRSSQDTAIYIGSIDKSKKIDFLLDSCEIVHTRYPNFKLKFFSNTPLPKRLANRISHLTFVEICGEASDDDFARISQIGHFILCPGRVGLIAVDSMHLNLPIISTAWKYHAPEFGYLEAGKDVLVSEESILQYSELVSKVVSMQIELHSFRTNLNIKSNIYTIENMVSNYHRGVTRIAYEKVQR